MWVCAGSLAPALRTAVGEAGGTLLAPTLLTALRLLCNLFVQPSLRALAVKDSNEWLDAFGEKVSGSSANIRQVGRLQEDQKQKSLHVSSSEGLANFEPPRLLQPFACCATCLSSRLCGPWRSRTATSGWTRSERRCLEALLTPGR
jgi:hypothetical protein